MDAITKCLRNEKGSANTDETRLMSVVGHLMCSEKPEAVGGMHRNDTGDTSDSFSEVRRG